MIKTRSIAIIGAPSSAGAYSPGQEKAPDALRAAGLIAQLEAEGFDVTDLGNTQSFRWRPDRSNPRAMHAATVAAVASEVVDFVIEARELDRFPMVIGGDCTVGLGTVAGLLRDSGSLGLVYFDFDADLQTPESTTDGALDWMGVAHMLGVEGTLHELVSLSARTPALKGNAVLLFGTRNIETPEQERIEQNGIDVIDGNEVAHDPKAAAELARQWSMAFDHVVLHFDVDVIDFEDFPIAEEIRRKAGLTLDQAMAALDVLLAIPNLAAITISEINPDHDPDGTTLPAFASRLASAFGSVAWNHEMKSDGIDRDALQSRDPAPSADDG
jgi:arginase